MNTVMNIIEEAKLPQKITLVQKWREVGNLVFYHGKRIVKANIDVASMLWNQRRGMSMLRVAVLIPMVGTPFFMNWSTGQIIEAVKSGTSLSMFGPYTLALALALIVSGALPLVLKVLERLIEHWAFVFVQQAQILKVPDLDPVTYSDPSLKDKIQQVQERAVWRIMGFAQSQLMLLRALSLALIACWMLANYNPVLCALVVLAMLPSMALEGLHAFQQFKVDERQGDWWRRFWEDRGHILESKSLAYLQIFGAAHWFAERFAKQLAKAIDQYDDLERNSVVKRVACMAVGMSAAVFAVYVLIRSVSSGDLKVAQFVFNLGALTLLCASLAEIASTLGNQFGQSLYVTSFQDVLALESRTYFPESGREPVHVREGVSVELRNVRFGYPQGAGKIQREVIRGLSFTIPASQKWALVGVNGAGKSTLNSLLVRLFDPDQGEVLIGGIRVSELSRATLRSIIGCLPQHIEHYNLTVEEFISLGRSWDKVDPDRVRWAAKHSGAASFVEHYPKRYEQRLGRDYKDSEEPSGGQLQKLALASLLYMKAPMMVLDEPTAAIDPEAARDFWDTLFHETPGQTVLFSTHYFGAVRRADCIVVLDQGQVLAMGRHDDLIVSCAPYKALFESQARDYRT